MSRRQEKLNVQAARMILEGKSVQEVTGATSLRAQPSIVKAEKNSSSVGWQVWKSIKTPAYYRIISF